jgi:hypothetical protein
MVWIKRNLFFVIGGVLALALLGAAAFYDLKEWHRNTAAFDKLHEIYGTLLEVTQQKLSPGNAKINNTETAKEQEQQIREWIAKTKDYFKPIAPIPNLTNAPVTSELFAAALRRTIDQLQHEADAANVMVQPKYGFSFEAQRTLVRFGSGLDSLALQLGEVKTISEILFAARVNWLDGVQRARVSDDDMAGPASDYIDEHSVTNDMAVVTPYMITFRAFSPEIAQVLESFATSPHGFIVKGINVQPATGGGAPESGVPQAMSGPPPGMPGTPGDMQGRGGLQTVLKEQLLRVTMEIEIVKPTFKN